MIEKPGAAHPTVQTAQTLAHRPNHFFDTFLVLRWNKEANLIVERCAVPHPPSESGRSSRCHFPNRERIFNNGARLGSRRPRMSSSYELYQNKIVAIHTNPYGVGSGSATGIP